uniref:Uncharacterized protein n=1 Tax=Nelumbo nucifera TaxID=4432 RepID=A0A822Z525_NELNU|nr:TPA_asm: hypothetical protein HUJ06_012887 [Nelumbo nucifera]
MAYRRKQGLSKASTFKEEIRHSPDSPSSSLAAQAIRASSAHLESSLSFAYGESALASARRESNRHRSSPSRQDSPSYEYTSMKSPNESKFGFWGVLARKAKSILEDDNMTNQLETPGKTRPQMHDISTGGQLHQSHQSPKGSRKIESPRFQKGLDAITSSLNYIGDTIGNAFEEGISIVENKTADIIQETRKINMRRKASGSYAQSPTANASSSLQQPQMQTDLEIQLKASRDVRWQLCITGSIVEKFCMLCLLFFHSN